MKYSNTEEGKLRIYNSIIYYMGKMMKEKNIPSFPVFLSIITNLMSCNIQKVFFKNAVQ